MASFYILSFPVPYPLIHPSIAPKQNKLTLSSVKKKSKEIKTAFREQSVIRAKVTLKGTTVERLNPFKHQWHNILLHNFNDLN